MESIFKKFKERSKRSKRISSHESVINDLLSDDVISLENMVCVDIPNEGKIGVAYHPETGNMFKYSVYVIWYNDDNAEKPECSRILDPKTGLLHPIIPQWFLCAIKHIHESGYYIGEMGAKLYNYAHIPNFGVLDFEFFDMRLWRNQNYDINQGDKFYIACENKADSFRCKLGAINYSDDGDMSIASFEIIRDALMKTLSDAINN